MILTTFNHQEFQPDDKTKHLSKRDKKKGKQQPKLKVTSTQMARAFEHMDADTNAAVTEDEFKDFFLLLIQLKFNSFDVDGSGTIDADEMTKFGFHSLGCRSLSHSPLCLQ